MSTFDPSFGDWLVAADYIEARVGVPDLARRMREVAGEAQAHIGPANGPLVLHSAVGAIIAQALALHAERVWYKPPTRQMFSLQYTVEADVVRVPLNQFEDWDTDWISEQIAWRSPTTHLDQLAIVNDWLEHVCARIGDGLATRLMMSRSHFEARISWID